MPKRQRQSANGWPRQVEAIGERHKVLAELQELERYADQPIKVLEKRLALYQQVAEVEAQWPDLANSSDYALKQRIDAIETIARLEPDAANRPSLKVLRERAKLLTTIEADSPPPPLNIFFFNIFGLPKSCRKGRQGPNPDDTSCQPTTGAAVLMHCR
jgi:hypothetical protein